MQSDGKILICGVFGTISGQTNRDIVHLNANGTHDTSFRTDVGDQFSPGAVNDIALQPNGKILIGGILP